MNEARPKKTIELMIVPLLAAAAALIVYKVLIAVRVGPGWDTYAFLVNAADFAGRSVGYIEPHRPPLLAALTSVFFRFGWMDTSVVQWVDGGMSLFGIAGMYFLLRRRFGQVPSAFGALALLAVPGLWDYLGVGYSDFASVALSIWAVLFFIKATEDHPAWYLAALPTVVLAVLMRYGALVMLFPIGLWLSLRALPFRHGRWIAGGTTLALLAYAPAAVYYERTFGDVLFPVTNMLASAGGAPAATTSAAAGGGGLNYVTNVQALLGPGAIGWMTLTVVIIAALGLLLDLSEWVNPMDPDTPKLSKFLLAGLVAAPAIWAQFHAGTAVRQLLLAAAILLVWRILSPREDGVPPMNRTVPLAAIDALFLCWALAYLDAHGHMSIRLSRYFMTMAPGLIYFVLRGWQVWADAAVSRWERLHEGEQVMRRSLGAKLLAAAVWSAYVATVVAGLVVVTHPKPRAPDPIVVGARDSAIWLKAQKPDLRGAVVYSDVWPLTSWYLGVEAQPMPAFKDLPAFQHELDKNRADYYFTIRGRRFEGYRPIVRLGSATILGREATAVAERQPRVQYLGDGWENYLERLCDYEFELIHSEGRYGVWGSAMMDAYDAKQLSAFDAVALFGAHWQDRRKGEAALRSYVENGGVLIIDASHNLDGPQYALADTIFLDTAIVRTPVKPGADIVVSPSFARAHPSVAQVRPSPFVDEGGGPWYGAAYTPLNPSEHRRTLAWVGGMPAVTVQRLGKGRIYWMAYNVAWHAFLTENDEERGLIRAVVREALGLRTPETGTVASTAARGGPGGHGGEYVR